MTMSDSTTPSVVLENFEANVLPASMKQAFRIARKWRQIPDTMTDDQALAEGLITPEVLELILTIIQDVIQNCMSNKQVIAWKRIRSYIDSNKETDRIGDTIRLNWLVDRWMNKLGFPRDRGDVTDLRQSLVNTTAELKEPEFRDLQTEILFFTI